MSKAIAPTLPSSADLIANINKKFGANTILRMDSVPDRQYDVVSSGSIGLDHAIGVGGFPRGRIIEIYGPESSGKTTLTLHLLANAQRAGGLCAFIDAEHALDVKYAESLGVDVPGLLLSQPDYGEQALEITSMLVDSGSIAVVVIDSVAALTPKAEIDGEVGDYHVGTQARMMSQALRKITAAASRTKTMVVFINQIRMKIGVKFGSPETTTGGNALKFYASVRLDTRRIAGVKDGEAQIANRTRVKVKKNKLAPPFREAEFDIRFGAGIDRTAEVIELGVAVGVVDKAGAWLSYKGDRIGQGRQRAVTHLEENPEVADAIEAEVRHRLKDAPPPTRALVGEGDTPTPAKAKKSAQATSTAEATARLMAANLPDEG